MHVPMVAEIGVQVDPPPQHVGTQMTPPDEIHGRAASQIRR